jgi:hypothetical protein
MSFNPNWIPITENHNDEKVRNASRKRFEQSLDGMIEQAVDKAIDRAIDKAFGKSIDDAIDRFATKKA